METKYTCPNCGREYMKKDTAKFCKFCGHKIVEQASASQPVSPVPAQDSTSKVPQPTAPASVQDSVGKMPQPTAPAPVQDSVGEVPQPTTSAPIQDSASKVPQQVSPTPAQGSGTGNTSQMQQPAGPVPGNLQNVPAHKPKKKGGMVAAIIAGIVLLLLMGVGTVLLVTKLGFLNLDFLKLDSVDGPSDSEAAAGEAGAAAETAADGEAVSGESAEALLQEAEALFAENKEKVLDDQLRGEAQKELQKAVELYQQAGSNEEFRAEALAGIRDVISYYEKGVQSQVDMLMAQEVSADIYREIVKNLDDALTYGQNLVDAGYDVSMNGTTDLRSNIEDKYKALYIEKYNGFIEEYNWNVRANEEFARGAYEAFPSDDPDDPIRLRYAYAKAWLVHQEIVEGMADGSLDGYGAVEKIMDALEETDYCEFLMEEAENYALNSSAPNVDYFTVLRQGSILPDSSSREYTADEIAALGLSAAELRYARIEIYARHGMNCWDTSVSNTLGSSGEIDMYKFMSYNDFGIYSTDTINGLTATERHNIRVIAQMEKDFAGSGYFMVNF